MKWHDLKELRARMLGEWVCETCGKKGDSRSLVGHHIKGRKRQADNVQDVRLRCPECEFIHHELDRHGNGHKREVSQFRGVM